jgi:hypothetical protein
MKTGFAVRARRSVARSLYEIDEELPPVGAVEFVPEWVAEALADYNAECRARPDVQMPPFEEYRWDWLDAKLHDELAAADVEALEERRAEEAMRRAPLPLASPCGDDELDFPF